MSDTTGDRWAQGDAYEAYMGRWSRVVAREFLAWLAPEPGGHWLEVGCGAGALTASVCSLAAPATVLATDRSASFVEYARTVVEDPRVSYVAAPAEALPTRAGGFDVVVSGLVLNFIAAPAAALKAMRERVRPGGVVAAFVWDYLGGVEFLTHFWAEAVASEPGAATFDEARRFEAWTLSYLTSLFAEAGFAGVEGAVLTVPTVFAGFDDYWGPFLGGAGPAPSYVASLTEARRDSLRERLRARLKSAGDGSISLRARALAVRGRRA